MKFKVISIVMMNVLNLFSQHVLNFWSNGYKMNYNWKNEVIPWSIQNESLLWFIYPCKKIYSQYILLNRALTHNSSLSTKNVVDNPILTKVWGENRKYRKSQVGNDDYKKLQRNRNRGPRTSREVPGRSRDEAGQDLETLKVPGPKSPGT